MTDYRVQVRLERKSENGKWVTYTWIDSDNIPSEISFQGTLWCVVEVYARFLVHVDWNPKATSWPPIQRAILEKKQVANA